jgi:N-dimethylarginine dimethylaminohydrolase
MEAVDELMDKDMFGTDKVVVVYCPFEDNDMHRIHLDCYFGAVGKKKFVIWNAAVQTGGNMERYVREYIKKGSQYVINEECNGIPLRQYMDDQGFEVVELSDECQMRYGCNVVLLPNDTVVVQDTESHSKIEGSIMVPFNGIHAMYGGLHCATQILP